MKHSDDVSWVRAYAVWKLTAGITTTHLPEKCLIDMAPRLTSNVYPSRRVTPQVLEFGSQYECLGVVYRKDVGNTSSFTTSTLLSVSNYEHYLKGTIGRSTLPEGWLSSDMTAYYSAVLWMLSFIFCSCYAFAMLTYVNFIYNWRSQYTSQITMTPRHTLYNLYIENMGVGECYWWEVIWIM